VDNVCRWLNIHRRNYSPEDAVDRYGQTPLHVAVQSVCDISVIERLLHGTTSYLCAQTPDYRQRYALHWACTNPNGIYKEAGTKLGGWGIRKKHIENMTLLICKLADVFPEAASTPDVDGCTPIDLAMKHPTDRRVKAALLKADFCTKQDQKLKQQRSKGSSTINSHTDSSGCDKAGRAEIPPVIEVIHNGQVSDSNHNPWGIGDDYSSMGSRVVSRRAKNSSTTTTTTQVDSIMIQI
jgi:ankyrin repeat protein